MKHKNKLSNKQALAIAILLIMCSFMGYGIGYFKGVYDMQLDMFSLLHKGWFWGTQICWERDENLALVMIDEYRLY